MRENNEPGGLIRHRPARLKSLASDTSHETTVSWFVREARQTNQTNRKRLPGLCGKRTKAMKEKEFYRSVVKVTGTISYVDINHKEKGIQEKIVDMILPDMDENGAKHIFDDMLEQNERFIDCEHVDIVPGKLFMKLSECLKIGRFDPSQAGKA